MNGREEAEALLKRAAGIDSPDERGKTPLLLAVETGRLKTVDAILKYHPNVDNESNRKSLLAAMQAYDVQRSIKSPLDDQEAIILYLRVYGFTIKLQDLDSCELLHKAIDDGLWHYIKDFVQQSVVDLNSPFFRARSKDKEGFTLLHTACEQDFYPMVACLLHRGAEIDATSDHGFTPLHLAVLKGHINNVKILLNRGANIDHQNEYGNTALFYAALRGNAEIVDMILEKRPDINNEGNRKSIRVAGMNNIPRYREVVKSLHRYGFTAKLEHIYDFELLENAILNEDTVIVDDFLKHHGKDIVPSFTSTRRCMPLHFAAKWYKRRIIEMMVNYGLDINAEDYHGQTPVFYAVNTSHLKEKIDKSCAEMVDFLRHLGADLSITDNKGKALLHYVSASYPGKIETARLLLERGANVHERCLKGRSPFLMAMEQKNVPLQTLFVNYMAADFKNATHRELLNIAALNGTSTLLVVPLESGADINAVYGRKTTLCFARENKYAELVEKLVEHGCDVSEVIAMLRVENQYNYNEDAHHTYLKRHIVKLIIAGLTKPDGLQSLLKYYQCHVEECSEELAAMKIENIPSTSLFLGDILTEDVTRLATYAKNEDLVKYLKSNAYDSKFPLYSSVIKGLIWRGICRNWLLERGLIVFRTRGGFFRELPEFCVEHILTYLSDEDLRILVKLL